MSYAGKVPPSTVFCDMSSDTPKLDTASNKIDFPASHGDTELLLSAMRQLQTIKVDDWPTAQRLLKVCRQFDFALVGDIIASQLGQLVDQAPLQIFAIASQYDNLALAKMALGYSYNQIWARASTFEFPCT